VLADADGGEPRAIVIASGSEVAVALEAREKLQAEGIPTRVVSMPSWVLFERQSREYRESVLPRSVRTRVAVEAAGTMGWHRWVGDEGEVVGITRFGESAPATRIFEELGLSGANVAHRVRLLLGLAEDEDGGEEGYAAAGPTRHGHDETS
jgi:transketolase